MNCQKNPLISVVIGAYNEEESIAKTLQNLLGQTISNCEIIVVDDGSTDSTADQVQKFDNPCVRLLRTEQNQGLPSALNLGINNARGKYIARSDADEISLPLRLERQSEILDEKEEAKVVAPWYRTVGRYDTKICDVKIPSSRNFDVPDLINNGPGIVHGSVMMRKEAVISVGGYREEFQLAQDYDLWLRMAETFGEGWLYILPDILYERSINASRLEKRQRQRRYATAARKSAELRQKNHDDTEVINNLARCSDVDSEKEYNERELVGMYHYLAGVQLLKQNKIVSARHRFLKAIWFAPLRLRPWYKLCITAIPRRKRQYIQSKIKSRIESRIESDF